MAEFSWTKQQILREHSLIEDDEHYPCVMEERLNNVGQFLTNLAIEELTSSFSKLYVDEKQQRSRTNCLNPFIIRLKDRPSNLRRSLFPLSWQYSRFKDPLTSMTINEYFERQDTRQFTNKPLDFQLMSSFNLNNARSLQIYQSVGLKNDCILQGSPYNELKGKTNDDKIAPVFHENCLESMRHVYEIGPFNYQRHSSFGSFLCRLLARAGRLSDITSAQYRENIM